MLKKLVYAFGLMMCINNSYCSNGLYEAELLKALEFYPENRFNVEYENGIEEDLEKLKNNYSSDANNYNKSIQELKKKYINCFYVKEYTDDELKKFKDIYDNPLFTDEDIKLYNLKKKAFLFVAKEVLKEIVQQFVKAGESGWNGNDLFKGCNGDVLFESYNILLKRCKGKYELIFSPYVTFYYDVYYEAKHNLCNNYKDIYIYVFDYGYTGNDIEKIEDKRYLIIKNSKDLDKVISGLKFPVMLKSKFFNGLKLYAKFLEDNKEEFEAIINFNNTISKEIKKLSYKLEKNKERVINGNFTIKTEKDKIIETFDELTDEDKKYMQEMKNKIEHILEEFEELKNSIKNVNVCKNLNIDEYKKCFEEKYGKIVINNIDKINKCLDENKQLEAEFDKSFENLKNEINELKNEINNIREKNDILDENLKNESLQDLNQYNDNFFDSISYKDLNGCKNKILLLGLSTEREFLRKKDDLKKKYLEIKNLKDSLCAEDAKNFQIEKEEDYNKHDFFIKLNVNDFKSIEKEIIDLEVKMNDIIKDREVNDNELKLKAEAERKKKLEEERLKKEEEDRIRLEKKTKKKENNKNCEKDSIYTSHGDKYTSTTTKHIKKIDAKSTSTIIDKSKIIKTDAKKGSGFGIKPIRNTEQTTTQTDSNNGCSCKKGGCSC